MASEESPLELALLELCRENPEGLSDKVVEEELPHIPVLERAQAVNTLLQKKLVQLFKAPDGSLLYKEVDQHQAAQFRGLTPDELLIFQVIKQAGNMGIWTRDMRSRSNLQHPQIAKILKTLEGRRLVKAVKTVASKNRKVYMLYDLDPSREVTGGAWYSENEFDGEFIAILRQQCLQLILKEGSMTLEEIADALRQSGVAKEELRLEDYRQVVETLVFDSEVEVFISTGAGRDNKYRAGVEFFKASSARVPDSSPFTSMPCGVCTVFRDCSDNGLISPKTCEYFQQWLQF